MINEFLVILSMLAVWRATHMLMDEEGPLGIFYRIQAWAANRKDTVGGINHGFDCHYCVSFWLSIPCAIFLSDSYFTFGLLTFAISAGAILIHHINNWLEQRAVWK